MAKRKELRKRVILQDGTAINVVVLDGILTEDLVVSMMKAEGYRVMTGKDAFPSINRSIKDPLIKLGILQD